MGVKDELKELAGYIKQESKAPRFWTAIGAYLVGKPGYELIYTAITKKEKVPFKNLVPALGAFVFGYVILPELYKLRNETLEKEKAENTSS